MRELKNKFSRFYQPLFVCCLLLTLFSGNYLRIAAAAWLALSFYFFKRPEFSVCALAFFGTFFHRSGFFPDFFFSLKHYHIAFLLLLMTRMVKGKLEADFYYGIRECKILYPVLGILLIGFAGSVNDATLKFSLLKACNFIFVIGSIVYLSGIMASEKISILRLLPYFIFGAVTQVFVNIYNLKFQLFLLELDWLYNNQFGSLMAMCIFYVFSLLLIEEQPQGKAFLWFSLLTVGLGLFLSLSRTAWLSFIAAASIFFILFLKRKRLLKKSSSAMAVFLKACGMLFLMVVAITFLNLFIPIDPSRMTYYFDKGDDVFWRVKYFSQIFDLNYWKFTFHDTQNFGFFGIDRLRQLQDLREILSVHPFFGIGFMQRVTNYHGFYFVLLGATGILGFGLFSLFVFWMFSALCGALKKSRFPEHYLLASGVTAAFFAWLISSITQSMFLHFSVWLNVLFALLLISNHNEQPNNLKSNL